jgi:hypothetical protein
VNLVASDEAITLRIPSDACQGLSGETKVAYPLPPRHANLPSC